MASYFQDGGHDDIPRKASSPQRVTSLARCMRYSKCKGKGRYSSSWEPHLRATGRHLPYGITVLSATRHK